VRARRPPPDPSSTRGCIPISALASGDGSGEGRCEEGAAHSRSTDLGAGEGGGEPEMVGEGQKAGGFGGGGWRRI